MTYIYLLFGITDNLHEPTPGMNHKPMFIGVVTAFLFLALFCAFSRLYCRAFIVHACGWDDASLVIVMIAISIGSVGACVSMDYGLGQHQLLITPQMFDRFCFIFYVCNISLPFSTTFIKIAVLLQYLRTFERGTKSYAFTLIILVLTAIWGTVYIVLACVPCLPVNAYWDLTVEAHGRWGFGSHDSDELVRAYQIHSTSNMLFDFIIFAIPLPSYLKKKGNTRYRKSLLALFLLASLVLIFATWRLLSIMEHRAATYPTLDLTWYSPMPIVLSILEIDLATICASLPVFWPVLQNSVDAIFVTQEFKITTETTDSHCEDHARHHLPDSDSQHHQPMTALTDTDGLIDRMASNPNMPDTTTTTVEVRPKTDTGIFGAYIYGKTTCDVEAAIK